MIDILTHRRRSSACLWLAFSLDPDLQMVGRWIYRLTEEGWVIVEFTTARAPGSGGAVWTRAVLERRTEMLVDSLERAWKVPPHLVERWLEWAQGGQG